MSTQQQASPATMKLVGAGLGIAGLLAVLVGFGVLPVPGGRDSLHGPLWIAALIGFIVMLAGASCAIQGIGRANANAELPADAPVWLQAGYQLIGVALFASFAALGTWIAFAGDARAFSGPGGVPVARIMFGLGALICWLATIALAVRVARKLTRTTGDTRA